MKKHFFAGTIIGLVSIVFMLWFIHTELLSSMELKLYDYRYKLRPKCEVNSNIVIAAIDDSSVQMIGRWPWPRKIHAAFLKSLSPYPPKCTGFDILFTEKEDEQSDTALVHFTKLLGNTVYAGYLNTTDNKVILPIKELAGTGSVGFINVPSDKDGIIRKIPLVTKRGDELLPSFVLQMLCIYSNVNFKDLDVRFGKYVLVPGMGKIPIDGNGCMWINYAGDQHVFKEIAFQQVLGWANDENKLKEFGNKLVIAGITATGIGDTGNIPVAVNVPLVTVHANALNTILNKNFINKLPVPVNIFVIIACILTSAFINSVFGPAKAGMLSFVFIILYCVASIWLFQKNIWIDILGPVFGFSLPFVIITVYRYGWEEKEKRHIRKVFAHYLSKEVIDAVLKEPGKLRLGGELRTATVVYVDLRNFSTYCEQKSPHDVVKFLNECFDWMTEIILRHGGMLDKYIGDAIMAIFGAPAEIAPEEQAEKAVSAALEIVKKWQKMPVDIRDGLDVGIGINTGHMLIGNMGSRYIFNYTAVGDEVNVASRVQGLTSQYKANIIITDAVNNLIKGKFKTEPLGKAAVKGRTEQVEIYQLGAS